MDLSLAFDASSAAMTSFAAGPLAQLLLAATEVAEPTQLAAWGTTLYNLALVAIGLGFVIFVHELGHFLAAKSFGVKCEKFYVGFDVPIRLGPIRLPAKLFHFRWGETEYGIGAIPLGGYVKMLGQDDDPRRAKEENARIRADGSGEGLTESGLDPRSYQAKPVYARMVIISAGVIMNLIFGALFAAAAFMSGVPYTPSVIGDTLPGDPAWVNNIQPGDKIVKAGDLPQSDQLRFNDLVEEVMMHGLDEPDQPIPMVIDRDGELIKFAFKGSREHDEAGERMMLGFTAMHTTQLSDISVFQKNLTLEAAQPDNGVELPDFQLNETIVAIDGETLPLLPGQQVAAGYELNNRLHPKLDQAVQVTVRGVAADGRPAADRVVTWQPVPRRTLGFGYAVGRITAVANDSPASQAGVRIADLPLSLNGEPIQDAVTLPLQVAALAGQSATLQMKRMSGDGGESTYEFSWEVPANFSIYEGSGQLAVGGYELPGSGLVVGALREITSVAADSTAAKAGLKPGDTLTQVKIMETQPPAIKKLFDDTYGSGIYKEQPLDTYHDAVYVNEQVQVLPVGTRVRLSVKRDGQVEQANLVVAYDAEYYSPGRGVMFQQIDGIYREPNFATALGLGVGEVGRRMSGVVDFLRLLVTQKMNIRNLGGPGVIFYAATREADAGPSRLLLFLTMLSANLAVLNFLPIPALDGGHFLFLTWEAIRGKPVDEQLQMQLTLGGVLALLCLMVFVIINDVMNLSRILG